MKLDRARHVSDQVGGRRAATLPADGAERLPHRAWGAEMLVRGFVSGTFPCGHKVIVPNALRARKYERYRVSTKFP